jgi:hypothetical protein
MTNQDTSQKFFLIIFLTLFLVSLVSPSSLYALDLRPFVVPANAPDHSLSTGELIHYTNDGSPGPASPKRMYKNQNYEQFFYDDSHIYRREDTSWATPDWKDVQCSNGDRGAYTLARCTGASYSTGSSITADGIRWIPSGMTPGQTTQSELFDVVPISAPSANRGNRTVCSPTNVSGYPTTGCSQSQTTQFVKLYAPGEFEFCTRINGVGITNSDDLIELKVLSGPGTGDTFYYMRNWGFVGFKAPGFLAGLMLPGADSSFCLNPEKYDCNILEADAPPIYISKDYQLAPPTTPAFNLQDTHHDRVSNDIRQQIASGDVVVCTSKWSAKANVNLGCQVSAADGSCTQYQAQHVDFISANFEANQKTNDGTRLDQKHMANVPIAKLEKNPQELKETIHSFGNDYVGYYSKAITYDNQRDIKDHRLEEAIKNRKGIPSESLDEQVAWGCADQCVSLGCKIEPDCRPVWMSEVALRLGKTSDSEIVSLYASTPLLTNQCYQKIYSLLELVDSGSMDTLVQIDDDSSGKSKEERQSKPQDKMLAAASSSQTFLASYYKPVIGDPCASISQEQKTDKPSPLTILDILIRVARLITHPGEITAEKEVKTYIPKAVVTGMIVDDTFQSSVLPEHLSTTLKDKPASSNDKGIVQPGNRNYLLRQAVQEELTPYRLKKL